MTSTPTVETAETSEAIPQSFPSEFKSCWRMLSNKTFFFVLLAAWMLLFHLIGNSTLGYFKTSSLIRWMYILYNAENSEDGHGSLILPVVLILFWWKRKELLATPQRTWSPGLLI